MRIIFIFLISLHLSILQGQENIPDPFEGVVVGIKDGDTYVVLYDKKMITVRLAHIDCPEGGQAFGKAAKKHASKLCYKNKVIVYHRQNWDRYGRLIAEVFLNTLCINKEMVRSGYAWHFLKYSKDITYSDIEKSAREAKLGLWSELSPIAPWQWRKDRRSSK